MPNVLHTDEAVTDFLNQTAAYIQQVTDDVESRRIYPRHGLYSDFVLLALLEKVLTTTRAVTCLAQNSFGADAFGLSRTAMEAFFFLRYIENKDTENRATRYLRYFAKDREHFLKALTKHYPQHAGKRSADHEAIMKIAGGFKSPHKWHDEPSLKEVVYEKSTWSDDPTKSPDWEYSYDVVYKMTSHHVHSTSVALEQRFHDFSVSSNYPAPFTFSTSTQRSNTVKAIVNVCVALQGSIQHVFHSLDIEVPKSIYDQFKRWEDMLGLA